MIFVFGSNLAGIHGAGAALEAVSRHGALRGVGIGRQGMSYAIPTKDIHIQTLRLQDIVYYIDQFIQYAKDTPALSFKVTRVGCGLAGYRDEEIAPLFLNAPKDNCFFDTTWRPFLRNELEYWGSYNL